MLAVTSGAAPRSPPGTRTSPASPPSGWPDAHHSAGVLGAGALGTIYAAHLSRAGIDVAFVATESRADRLSRGDLTVNGASVDIPATPRPAGTPPSTSPSSRSWRSSSRTPSTRPAEPYEAGSIAESWRQQPGNPAYGTDLTLDELPDALARADVERAPRRRDLVVAVFAERLGTGPTPDAEWGVAVSRPAQRLALTVVVIHE
ncbi:hypothetical protein JNO54_00250 [Janibacter sp. YIM B02568]|nr:hypothetical protein [Janibacter endophyticus]